MAARITAMGMASCLGPVSTACAAARAGVARVAPLPDFQYQPAEGLDRLPLSACAIPASTFGFAGIGRLVAILHETLLDLLGDLDPRQRDPDAALFLALPDPLDLEIPLSSELEGDAERRAAAFGSRIVERALESVRSGWALPERRFFGEGRTAFPRALKAALDELATGRRRTCLVAAIDTLLDRAVLERLLVEERLKTEDRPTGLVPGEAGVALVLQAVAPKGSASHRAPVQVRAVALRPADDASPGRALADCADEAFRAAGGSAEPLLVSDHNGEHASAQEWGGALVRLRSLGPAWTAPPSWFPAIGFGDTGTAAAAVGACLAARGVERGYAPSRMPVVLSSGEDEKAAVVIAAA